MGIVSGVFCSDLMCVVIEAVLSSINPSPGVARQLLTFFASPKKVSKERRPRDPGPPGFPVLRSKKWEGKQTRCAQTSFPSFSIFRIASPAGSKRKFQTGSLRIAWGRSPSASQFLRGRAQLCRRNKLCSDSKERRPLNHRPPLARRSEPVWNSRLRAAGGGECKSDKEGKLV